MKLLSVQKRLAASILKCSPYRISLNPDHLEDIKEAITKIDIKGLINQGSIIRKPVKSTSRVRARKKAIQKRKGRRTGHGSRKGKKTARLPKKENWKNKVRLQRKLLKELRDKKMLTTISYRELYQKSKGGFFRSKRHVKLYIEENKLLKK